MARGAVRGALAAWLGLITLQAVASSGSGRVASAFADVAGLVDRVIDPAVPAIPDRRTGSTSAAAAGVAAGQALGGSSVSTGARATGRLPIPAPPK